MNETKKNPLKFEEANNSVDGTLMQHEGRLGYVEAKLESFATKSDIKELDGKIGILEERLRAEIKEAIGAQTKWQLGILVTLVIGFLAILAK